MLWSLLKVALFVAFAAAIAWGASLVMETSGHVQIAFGGREVLLSPLDFIIALLVLFLLLWVLLKLAGFLVAILRFLNGDDTAISRYFDRNRERRGLDALVDAMIAITTGDGREAMNRAAKAERLLPHRDLTRLVAAQAAELAGNSERAEALLREMVESDRTRFAGVLGLMRRRLAEGRRDLALKLAEKAQALRPGHREVLDTLFRLQTEAGDWAGARQTLQAMVRARHLPRDVGARRDAVLLVAQARAAEQEGRTDAAREAAAEAIRLAPALVPAAVTAARLKAAAGDRRGAERILRRAWAASPHPDIAAAWAALEPEESPEARLARFRPLLDANPDHPESRMLAAELALAAEDFPAARRALGDLPETRPTARSLALAAAIERGQGAPERVVRGYLTRALGAPRGEQWLCTRCNHAHAGWAPTCENCGAFDTLAWQLPDRAEAPPPGAALPLIVGAIDADDGPGPAREGEGEGEAGDSTGTGGEARPEAAEARSA